MISSGARSSDTFSEVGRNENVAHRSFRSLLGESFPVLGAPPPSALLGELIANRSPARAIFLPPVAGRDDIAERYFDRNKVVDVLAFHAPKPSKKGRLTQADEGVRE